MKGINKATAIVGLNPGAAPIKSPPIVPKTKINKFSNMKTLEKYPINSIMLKFKSN